MPERDKRGRSTAHSANPRTQPAQRRRRQLPADITDLVRIILDRRDMQRLSWTDQKALLFEVFERVLVDREVAKAEGHIETAAKRLGLHRQSLEHIMHRRGMMHDWPRRRSPQ